MIDQVAPHRGWIIIAVEEELEADQRLRSDTLPIPTLAFDFRQNILQHTTSPSLPLARRSCYHSAATAVS
jgi:hypothetical protein